jgi:hypothetical protein
MKKVLLFAAMAAVSVAMNAQTDFTPEAYKFSQRAVGEKLIMQADPSWLQWNVPAISSAKIEEYAPNGGFVALNVYTDANIGMNATCIVDLGGDIGHVLAITGASMEGLNEAYAAAGIGAVANEPEAGVGSMQINMYTDPSTTPPAAIVQSDIVVNAWANNTEPGQVIWENYYHMTSANDVTPLTANNWAGNKLYITDFCQYDDEGDLVVDDDENAIYDPTRWLRLTTLIKTLAKDTDEWPYSNAVKAKLWTGGSFGNVVLFIKELTFKTTEFTADSEEFTSQTDHQRTYEVWNPEPGKIADAIKTVQTAAKFDVQNGKFFSLENAEVFTLDGKRVLAGTQGELTAGAYIAKINGVCVKFTVK